jgi:hypothetical protein
MQRYGPEHERYQRELDSLIENIRDQKEDRMYDCPHWDQASLTRRYNCTACEAEGRPKT